MTAESVFNAEPLEYDPDTVTLMQRAADAELRAEAAEHALHSLLAELKLTSDQRRVPIRTENEVLVSLAQLAEEQLAELKHIRVALSANEERSSFEIDSNGSAGSVKFKAKPYATTVAEAREAAHYEFVKEMALLELAKAAGWAATLAALDAEQAKRKATA